MNIRDHLPLVEAPESIWEAIEAAAQNGGYRAAPRSSRWRMVLTAAAAISLAVAAAYWFGTWHSDWIETGATARITLRIGDIGTVEIGPNTRLRVVTDRSDQHRLSLAHGTLSALISAPPRLFFVDTKSGTAIDLGCEYSLHIDDEGFGVLRVTRGWVLFQRERLESMVPAGAMCRIRPLQGPGLPYFGDASPEFIEAVEQGTVDSMLGYARIRDTLTLWHLLPRAAAADRPRIYDRIAALTPLPTAISRDRALALDPEILNLLRDELAGKW